MVPHEEVRENMKFAGSKDSKIAIGHFKKVQLFEEESAQPPNVFGQKPELCTMPTVGIEAPAACKVR